jgi:putative DNA primase/helicase
MEFMQFAQAHGLIVDHIIANGRVQYCPTLDHPKKKNGRYMFDGLSGWVMNWATMTSAAGFRNKNSAVQNVDYEAIARRAAQAERDKRNTQQKAAYTAKSMLDECSIANHPYLVAKGLEISATVRPNGELLIPMRDMNSNAIINAQRIAAPGQLITLRSGEQVSKAFTPGARPLGAVFKIGRGADVWLCEGYATAQSLHMALRTIKQDASVWACFSAVNMKHVAASADQRPSFVFADNDTSQTGQLAAQAIGLPWVMSPAVGEDANDVHARLGLAGLGKLLRAFYTRL